VTTPETFSLNESVRVRDALAESEAGLKIAAVVLNRAVTSGKGCSLCAGRARATKRAVSFVGREFRGARPYVAPDDGQPVLGPDLLRSFGAHVFGGKPLRMRHIKPKAEKVPELKRAAWPAVATPLTLTSGKGGVGKTTVSAALAFVTRKASRKPVTICSTDPAPSLDDVFQADVGDEPRPVLGDRELRALEIDSVAHFRTWAEEMRAKLDSALTGEQRGVHVDLSLERRVISALLDIVPPGVDEVFAIFRILDLLEAGEGQVIIDMAPTGHALELLRMPERLLLWSRLLLKTLAPHRTLTLAQDLAVEIATVGQRVRDLLDRLKDRRQAVLVPVMLAEPMPDRETERLLHALDDIGAHATLLFVNRVLLPEQVKGCRRCSRARQWQQATLARVAGKGRRAIYVVPDFGREIAGRLALREFTKEIWRIQ
jgi:arsenite-transporting ATPase